MAKKFTLQIVISLLILLALLPGCEKPFSYSLYDAHVVGEYRYTTEKNLQQLAAFDTGYRETIRVALLADTHYHFDELNDAIQDINKRSEALLTFLIGDITEHGLLSEYVFIRQIMERLTVPYLTVIGNHDYLANGETIYQQMFGNFNYSFVFDNIKFIIFDDVFWESEKTPDFLWLKKELEDKEDYRHVFVVAHIPPFDDQLRDEYKRLYHRLLVENGVALSIHGHAHKYSLEELYGDGVFYLTVPSPQKRSYCELVIDASGVRVEKFDY